MPSISARAAPDRRCRLEPGDDVDEAAGGLAPRSTAIELVARSRRRCPGDMNRKPAGMTPMTSAGLSFNWIDAADDARVAAEASLPQLMAEDGDPRRVRPVVLGRHRPAEQRLRRRAAGRTPRRRAARSIASARRRRSASRARRRHAASDCERAALALPVEPVGRRDGVAAASTRRCPPPKPREQDS